MSDDITTLLPTTELEAVNAMLDSISESPIESLVAIESADAGAAHRKLHEVSKAVQLIGWHWNTDEQVILTPSTTDGSLTVPANTLKVILADTEDADLVQRGVRMYDRINHTYVFTKTVKVALITALPFGDLPEAARQYIMLRAADRFQQGAVGSAQLDKFARESMMAALMALEAAEAETGRYNILTGSWDCFRVINRTSPP